MAQIALSLIAVTFAFFFIQLVSSQTISTACQDAFDTYRQNIGQCTATSDNPTIICDQPCRGYFEGVINNCDISDFPVSS